MALETIISNLESNNFFNPFFFGCRAIPAGDMFQAGLARAGGPPTVALPLNGNQITKSVYSGFTASVGGDNMPAATVALVPCSIKMNEPVSRFVL